MKPWSVWKGFWTAGMCLGMLVLAGCAPEKPERKGPSAPKTDAKTAQATTADAKTAESKAADSGPPAVKVDEPAPNGETPVTPAEKAAPVKEPETAAPPAKEAEKPAPAVKDDQRPTAEPVAKPAGRAEKPEDTEIVTPNIGKPMPKEEEPKTRDLGPPLVDDEKQLKRLDPVQPIWVDMKQKQVVFQAVTCQAEWPLEFFATLPDRGYEAVVTMTVKPSVIHAGLLAVGAKAGSPVKFEPKYTPPSGTEVAIEVRWKDKDGKLQKSPAQKWIRNIKTKKPMDVNWVFAGSMLRKDEETGQQRYLGDSGDFITVLNLPTATLDIPMESTSAMETRSFEGFVENMPPEGTPVTVVLMPKVEKAK